MNVPTLLDAFEKLVSEHGWAGGTVCEQRVVGDDLGVSFPVRFFHTVSHGDGPAVWIISGIHGEEIAGPIALSRSIAALADLGLSVRVVLVPLCNPSGFSRCWRFPDSRTADDARQGHSVGDSEWLLPVPGALGPAAREAMAPLPETRSITEWVVAMQKRFPVVFSVDLHEDCRQGSTIAGHSYVYSSIKGDSSEEDALAEKLARMAVDAIASAGLPPLKDGTTRFGEAIRDGVVGFCADGSIDELLGAKEIVVGERFVRGPSAKATLVTETPGSEPLEVRIRANEGVIGSIASVLHWFDAYLNPASPSGKLALETVGKSEKLANAPLTVFLARYGGGDGMAAAGQRLAFVLPHQLTSTPAFRELRADIQKAYEGAIAEYTILPEHARVASLPRDIPPSLDGFQWDFHFVVSDHLPTCDGRVNLFFQGWLFDRELRNEPEALGRSRWPLVGLFHSHGFFNALTVGADSVSSTPFDGLMPMDQHVHVVAEDIPLDDGTFFHAEDWHFGSDSAQVCYDGRVAREYPRGWMVCVDVEMERCLASYAVVVGREAPSIANPGTIAELSDLLRLLHVEDATLLSAVRSSTVYRKCVVITGATSGIGMHTAQKLIRAGARVIIHGRTRERCAEAAVALGLDPAKSTVHGDLSSMDGARGVAAQLKELTGKVDVLINNAGYFHGNDARTTTADGLELTFAVNVAAQFIITTILAGGQRPLLASGSHVINVASISQSSSIDISDLQMARAEQFTGVEAYERSKLAVVTLTMELARRMAAKGVRCNTLDPGTVNTKMLLQGWGPIGIDVSEADDEFLLATAAGDFTGKYFVANEERPACSFARNRNNQKALWKALAEITGSDLQTDL